MDESIRTCRQCGAAASAESVFCPNCGSRLEPQPAPATAPAAPAAEAVAAALMQDASDAPAVEPAVEPAAIPDPSPQVQAGVSSIPQPQVQPASFVPPPQQAQPAAFAPPPQQAQPAAFAPPPQQAQPAAFAPPPQQQAQPAFAPGAFPTAVQAPALPKKTFPFFYAILSGIMVIGLLYWAFCFFLWPAYKAPVLTEDAQRWMLFMGSIVLVAWNIGMRIRMAGKKGKILPNILGVFILLAILYGYGMIEQLPGDGLHDLFVGLTESILDMIG